MAVTPAPIGQMPQQLDVLVLHPPAPGGETARRPVFPQTELAQIGAVVQAAGYSVDVIDAVGLAMDWAAITTYFRHHAPRYLVLHVDSAMFGNDLHATAIARSFGGISIAVGAHVTALPRETLDACRSLDVVVRGEPERGVLDVIMALDRATDRLLDRAALLPYALRDVAGVAFRATDSDIQITPNRPFLANLDTLPIPLHHMLPWKRYRLPMFGSTYAHVHTSRGCPASCRFCVKHVQFQSSVRHRSVEHVLKELYMLEKMGVQHIHFASELFTINRSFVYELCSAMAREHLTTSWSCNSRVDFVDAEALRMMQRAGCRMVLWGLESGSATVLRRAMRTTPLDRTHEIIRASQRLGLINRGAFMIGLPGETTATIQETIALAKALPLDQATFQVARPLPGTPLYYEAIANDWLTPDPHDGNSALPFLHYPALSASDMAFWAKRAAREWSLRPSRFRSVLKHMSGRNRLSRRPRSQWAFAAGSRAGGRKS